MCSVQEDVNDLPVKKTSVCLPPRTCMKCDENPVVIIRMNDAFCRECFRHYCVHKFRATFGRTHIVQHKEKVLLAYSGGQGSSAMLHLVIDGLSERTHKKIGFIPGVVYIDEGATIDQSFTDRMSKCAEISTVMKSSGFPSFIVPLEKATCIKADDKLSDKINPDDLTNPGDKINPDDLTDQCSRLNLAEKDTESLTTLLSTFTTLTAKIEFIKILRHKLLLDIARENGYTKVMMGNTATNLSISTLSNIAQGKGAHLSLDTGFIDDRDPDITILRSMREFSAKEAGMYNSFFGLECVTVPNVSTKATNNASIFQLTEAFVTGLQADFPSTVPTIFRTGSKMTVNDSKMVEDRCSFCQSPLDTDVGEASALNATQLSMRLSRKVSDVSCTDNTECCGAGDGSCHSNNTDHELTVFTVNKALCYGCRLLVRDMNDLKKLPNRITNKISKQQRRKKMKEEISDFLLNEEDDSR